MGGGGGGDSGVQVFCARQYLYISSVTAQSKFKVGGAVFEPFHGLARGLGFEKYIAARQKGGHC